MALLARLLARLRGHRPRPLPPVAVSNSFPTFVLAVDRPAPIPDRLLDLAIEAVARLRQEVSLDDLAARPRVPDYFKLWPGEHYAFLAGLMLALRPQTVVEVGTFSGLSALTMRKYLPPGGKVVTFDIVPWDSVGETVLTPADFADGALSQRLADLSDPAQITRHRDILQAADFLFIDAPKDGRFEFELMRNLAAIGLPKRPILMFDDTKLISMLRFWHELPHPKLDVTSLAHWSGSGLVEWA